LAREVSVLTSVFTTLKQQLETAKIEEVKELDYVIVLDPPEAPLIRSKPNKRKMVILAGFLGIGLGLVLAFCKEYVENSDSKDQDKIKEVKISLIKNLKELIPGKKI
jgi:uncharacterized protein involved in exopolysaccharide biosynthesis